MSDVLSSTMAQYVPAAAGQMASGGFGLLGGYMNYLYNRSLASQQNEYNLEMWKMTNEYNSPQAQMQRFKEAGLNPNLIYGQGNSGNASSPPQMVVPNAPDFSKGMQEIGKAFNIENLKTIIANRKKAEAEAENERTNAVRNERELFAEEKFGKYYSYDYKTGQYVERPPDPYGHVSVIHPAAYYINRILENNYNRAHLLPYRSALLEQQKNYLVPQVWMENYNRRFYPVNYWIGNGTKVLNALPTKFNFRFGGPNTLINNNSQRHFTPSYQQSIYNY